ncbi:MAG: hypothetical protein K2J20_01220 [Bacilli bacterium]|nr:hypothetical protein [Bacilli bacterium]
MKINNNRDYESMQAEGYFNANYESGNVPAGSCCEAGAMMGETMPGVVCPPVYECPRETVCHRYICHEVPHIMPCNTRIINHHIYRHTYTPTYSCCEENEVQNVYERKCC